MLTVVLFVLILLLFRLTLQPFKAAAVVGGKSDGMNPMVTNRRKCYRWPYNPTGRARYLVQSLLSCYAPALRCPVRA